MWRTFLDLIGVMVLATLVLVITLMGVDITWLKALLALPLALFGVGYAVGAAFFPFKRLEGPERFLLSLGLSLSILILGGLLLHLGPGGLHPEYWAMLLFLISAVAAGLAFLRRWEASPIPGAPAVTQTVQLHPMRRAVSPLPVLLLGLSALIVAISAVLVSQPAPQADYQGYSTFWMAPDLSGAPERIELGVRSMEFDPQSYRIELYAGGQLVELWNDIRLAPEQEWSVSLNSNEYPHGNEPLEAQLYRADQPNTPYRQARLWPSTAMKPSLVEGQ